MPPSRSRKRYRVCCLSTFRDIDERLRAELAAKAEQGCFVLRIGGSSAGKTRTLYEAVRAAVADWGLVHPGDAEAIHRLAEAPTPHTVVWLDELQRYLGPGAGLTAGTVRCLIQAGAVLAATMWGADQVSPKGAMGLGRGAGRCLRGEGSAPNKGPGSA